MRRLTRYIRAAARRCVFFRFMTLPCRAFRCDTTRAPVALIIAAPPPCCRGGRSQMPMPPNTSHRRLLTPLLLLMPSSTADTPYYAFHFTPRDAISLYVIIRPSSFSLPAAAIVHAPLRLRAIDATKFFAIFSRRCHCRVIYRRLSPPADDYATLCRRRLRQMRAAETRGARKSKVSIEMMRAARIRQQITDGVNDGEQQSAAFAQDDADTQQACCSAHDWRTQRHDMPLLFITLLIYADAATLYAALRGVPICAQMPCCARCVRERHECYASERATTRTRYSAMRC